MKAIIFDLNGTLLDDYEYNIKAFQMVFERLGLSIPHERLDLLLGKSDRGVQIGERLLDHT